LVARLKLAVALERALELVVRPHPAVRPHPVAHLAVRARLAVRAHLAVRAQDLVARALALEPTIRVAVRQEL